MLVEFRERPEVQEAFARNEFVGFCASERLRAADALWTKIVTEGMDGYFEVPVATSRELYAWFERPDLHADVIERVNQWVCGQFGVSVKELKTFHSAQVDAFFNG